MTASQEDVIAIGLIFLDLFLIVPLIRIFLDDWKDHRVKQKRKKERK